MALDENKTWSQLPDNNSTPDRSTGRIVAMSTSIWWILCRMRSIPTRWVKAMQAGLRCILMGLLERRDQESRSNILERFNSIESLEKMLGPIQLLIVSQESGRPIIQHRIDNVEVPLLQQKIPLRSSTVKVHGQSGTYSIWIQGIEQPISDERWTDLIKRIIDSYIRKCEQEWQMTHQSELRQIKDKEEKMNPFVDKNSDYRNLISGILRNKNIPWVQKAQQDPRYIKHCIEAIDICRIISRLPITQDDQDLRTISSEIDTILGWRIHREVLDMVTTILLSRDEMMNWLGYPSNLSKSDIPLEGRLYQIIRAYEAYCSDILPDKIPDTMQQWAKKSCIDNDLLEIFLKSLQWHTVPIANQESKTTQPVSEYRYSIYNSHIKKWNNVTRMINGIKDHHWVFYTANSDESKQKQLRDHIDLLKSTIPQEAGLVQLLIVERHGEDDGTHLTKQWIIESNRRWKQINWLLIDMIHSSSLPRCRETAQILWESISDHNGSPSIEEERSLDNPSKLSGIKRWIRRAEKFLVDRPRGLAHFLDRKMSIPEDSVAILVTHGTIIKYIELILRDFGIMNLSEEGLLSTDDVRYHLMRWGNCVKYDLVFPIIGWGEVMSELHTITESIFDDTFSQWNPQKINLIKVHKKLLDYIDNKNETDPEGVWKLIQALDDNPLTAHFSAILRTEWVIK